jgi:uncharacterized iron-regulated protein
MRNGANARRSWRDQHRIDADLTESNAPKRTVAESSNWTKVWAWDGYKYNKNTNYGDSFKVEG